MGSRIISGTKIVVLALLLSVLGFAQSAEPRGTVVIPASSVEKAGDMGRRAHTNVRIFVPEGGPVKPTDGGGSSGFLYYETPASLACVYKLVTAPGGCSPRSVFRNATGGSKAIAIVDAFDNPTAASDLNSFSSYFQLPPPNLEVVYATGTQPPPADFGWYIESALDVEMAHAMAPNAKIYLVEAASDNFSDLATAIGVANNLVAAAGGGQISMSWGGSEWAGEIAYDALFTTPGVTYFAAAGDSSGTIYPSVSANVVAAGGTTNRRDAVSGNLIMQAPWEDAGGGMSLYEGRPSYQDGIVAIVGKHRGVPDVSAVANPYTGSYVFAAGGEYIVGGTSVASPILAGIVNQAGNFAPSTKAELATIYNNLGVATNFKDVTKGFCGFYMGDSAATGWDFCTGVGSPVGLQGK
jgi:kumamolisin